MTTHDHGDTIKAWAKAYCEIATTIRDFSPYALSEHVHQRALEALEKIMDRESRPKESAWQADQEDVDALFSAVNCHKPADGDTEADVARKQALLCCRPVSCTECKARTDGACELEYRARGISNAPILNAKLQEALEGINNDTATDELDKKWDEALRGEQS